LSGLVLPLASPVQKANNQFVEGIAVSVTTAPCGLTVFVGFRFTVPDPFVFTVSTCVAAADV